MLVVEGQGAKFFTEIFTMTPQVMGYAEFEFVSSSKLAFVSIRMDSTPTGFQLTAIPVRMDWGLLKTTAEK